MKERRSGFMDCGLCSGFAVWQPAPFEQEFESGQAVCSEQAGFASGSGCQCGAGARS